MLCWWRCAGVKVSSSHNGHATLIAYKVVDLVSEIGIAMTASTTSRTDACWRRRSHGGVRMTAEMATTPCYESASDLCVHTGDVAIVRGNANVNSNSNAPATIDHASPRATMMTARTSVTNHGNATDHGNATMTIDHASPHAATASDHAYPYVMTATAHANAMTAVAYAGFAGLSEQATSSAILRLRTW
ncbi:hypothetical protein PHYBOEH_007645 [Phytophthora boehmeriae]|uniref:Uncharacterized protein n=1 Tax=Phytophthora boehmeriae TaxID=109152 RepID=A0A8T1W522_9STRA|nr:hypothetical protein PHYBOEH_007645 [Phytophthora boehmeriae]